MNRRNFLRAGAAIGTTSLATTCLPKKSCWGQDFREDETAFSIDCEIQDGFSTLEGEIIIEALQLVANRLTSPHIWQNMYELLGERGCYLADGVWKRSNVGVTKGYERYELLRWQLTNLRPTCPVIHVVPYSKRGTSEWGRASLGRVALVSTERGRRVRIEGEFEVKLNRDWVGRSGPGSSPDAWAGLIAHEMLHNLGHRHHDYSHRWQINAFQQCVKFDGVYRA